MTALKCLFLCTHVEEIVEGSDNDVSASFDAVVNDDHPEAPSYTRWTPSGQLHITVAPDRAAGFNVGECYYITIEPAPRA